MRKRTITEAFPPGEFIQDELDARGWTYAELAKVMGRPVRAINEIITAKTPITPRTALGLAKALGTSADVWLNLERAYRLSVAQSGAGEASRNGINRRMGVKKHL
jgi:addiction module HigA family antidote